MTSLQSKGDLIGHVRARVNRDKPLSGSVEVYLDQRDHCRPDGTSVVDPFDFPGTVARLYLLGDRLYCETIPDGAPVAACLPGVEYTPTTASR